MFFSVPVSSCAVAGPAVPSARANAAPAIKVLFMNRLPVYLTQNDCDRPASGTHYPLWSERRAVQSQPLAMDCTCATPSRLAQVCRPRPDGHQGSPDEGT